jgi:hypothetical protein
VVHTRKWEEEELLNIEESLKTIYESEEGVYSSLESKEALLQLEKKKRKLLEIGEAKWKLKSHAIWLENGDEFFFFFMPMPKEGRCLIPYGLYELIGRDLLKVVEEASLDGHMHAPLNSTFITLIPKSNSLEYFEDFKPISLCNSIYKVVAKIIARRLKPILSTTISKEQFGFLEGR